MAFRKSGSKRSMRRRPFSTRRRKGPTVKTVNRKVKVLQKRIELKWADVYYNQELNNSASGTMVQLLNGLLAGTTANQRIGNEVHWTSLQFRGTITMDSLRKAASNVRLIIFWDRQANQAAPQTLSTAISKGLLEDTTVTDLFLSPFSYPTQDRYRVLYDKRWVLNPQLQLTEASGSVTVNQPYTVSFKKKIQLNRSTKYDANNDVTVAGIMTNSLYALFYADSAAVSDEPTMKCGFRLYFKDA
ncbi:MAG: capsid protein [Circoviridae sp.]|nr:MAG: capsid protein [Circoviridae sp.]